VAANLVTAATATFGLLFASRLVAGSVHGAFIGVASVVAAVLAGPGRAGRALAIVFGGVALSTVIGVPSARSSGRRGWRATSLSVVALGAVALVLVVAFVPRVEAKGSGRLRDEARSALTLPVLATLGVGYLITGGEFTALTYLAPFLDEVTGIAGGPISAFLLVFGIATAAGTFATGRAADRSAAGRCSPPMPASSRCSESSTWPAPSPD
jgi:DHA1 family inner membrane transport protein